LLSEDPERIPLDVAELGSKLAVVNPVSRGLSAKTFSNIKSDFLAAVKASELTPLHHRPKAPLSADWARMMAQLSGKRPRVGLSHLARYASAKGIAPDEINLRHHPMKDVRVAAERTVADLGNEVFDDGIILCDGHKYSRHILTYCYIWRMSDTGGQN
jgi:hypothetical protein